MNVTDRIGAWLDPSGCFFRVWAPNARAVAVLIQDGPYWEMVDVIARQALTKTDGYWEIASGLEPGAKVVTQANFLIDSESRLKSALAGLAPPPGGHEHGSSPSGSPGGAIERKVPSPARVAPSPKRPDPHAEHAPSATPTPDHSGHSH